MSVVVATAASLSIASRGRLMLSPVDMPPLPSMLGELLQIANDPVVSSERLEQVIARDQVSTLRVLTVANSAYYGCSRQIESVRRALSLLGTRQVQHIASALALAPTFESAHGPALWRHGLACALWSERVVARLGLPPIDALFTAALMHDIGIVIMLMRGEQWEQPCLDDACAGRGALPTLERAVFGFDHAELGAKVCQSWRLPEPIWQLIERHERPVEQGDVAHAVLAIADHLAGAAGMPAAAGLEEPEPPRAALGVLGLDGAALEQLLGARDDIEAQVAVLT